MSATSQEFEFGEKEFQFLAQLVHQRVGIVLKEHKRQMMYSRLTRRLRALGFKSFKEYCDFVAGPRGEEEMNDLVNAITTNLTAFFREPHHFEHLKKEVLQPMTTNEKPRKVRLWSAACSSGVEAYSMAMMVDEVFGKKAGWDVKILATDIDTNMLSAAQKGQYSNDMAAKIPTSLREKYTMPYDADTIDMRECLKKMIHFKPLNLLKEFPFKGPFDAVFCRNVIIYFDKPTQSALFKRIAGVMGPKSYLYIGHSENLFNVSHQFEGLGRTIYQKIV